MTKIFIQAFTLTPKNVTTMDVRLNGIHVYSIVHAKRNEFDKDGYTAQRLVASNFIQVRTINGMSVTKIGIRHNGRLPAFLFEHSR